MRNSNEFPRWLNDPETQKKLNGKNVMMYCTGGIRCERASALMNQISSAQGDKFKPAKVAMVRGGIERYMKTFPEGGFWKGKNYVFDRRIVQVSEEKDEEKLQQDIESVCACCNVLWDQYRGKYTCKGDCCGVPVLVCQDCIKSGKADAPDARMLCPLCVEGFVMPAALPDFSKSSANKRPAEGEASAAAAKKARAGKQMKVAQPSQRLFVGNLPFTVDSTMIKAALVPADSEAGGEVQLVKWLTNHQSGAFYGSTFVHMSSLAAAEAAVALARGAGIAIKGRKTKVNFAPLREAEAWPPADHEHRERPPVM
jgi:hypothetical protein